MIADALPPKIAALLPADQLALLHRELRQLEEPPRYAQPARSDWLGAAGVCILVFSATLPVVVPFMFITDATLALRASNAVAIVMLFLCGWLFGHYSGFHRTMTGLGMVFFGLALVLTAIALGG